MPAHLCVCILMRIIVFYSEDCVFDSSLSFPARTLRVIRNKDQSKAELRKNTDEWAG